ncbi:MAG: type II toxin-antitoxin system Phd/YefM family antitoxin [Acidobacteria bacterium]|nr:type II toxin-antitoxin system Phd/YefM family antitoxin [Acidobacteriota bacterium]MBI3658534.1 type II toxin-antitoxin system Phd/YefM family antitoxin [Acidobacteriota bacterium]
MKLSNDIDSLSNFKRKTSQFLKQMKKTKRPVVLTVHGKAKLVVQDTKSYQALLVAKERLEALEGIRRGLESIKKGQGRPAEQLWSEFFAKHGIPGEE